MLRVGKLEPLAHNVTIRSGVRAFLVPQPAKQRKRPIFEPLLNGSINRSALPPLRYPSRCERRNMIAQASYFMQFDFMGWYDQFPLDHAVQNCYVVRLRSPVMWNGDSHTLMTLTRAPMGASWSAHTAQTVTWAILEPVLVMPGVSVVTMIDNVAIMSEVPEKFAAAVKTFLDRCKLFGATLNDVEKLPVSDDDIIACGRMSHKQETFLGEVYENGFVSNTANNVEKLSLAFRRLQRSLSDDSIVITRRHMASLIGLSNFLAHTLGISARENFELVRLHSRVAAMPTLWDDPLSVSPHMVSVVGGAIAPLLANKPSRPVKLPSLPSLNNSDYDVVAIVDASATGFGAIILMDDKMYEVKGGW
eukprot:PhM_4_TR16755/c1_g1_i1/m.26695